jgi:hypothetical protein
MRSRIPVPIPGRNRVISAHIPAVSAHILDVPVAIIRAQHRKVGHPISIIITGDRDITIQSPGSISLVFDVPVSIGGTVNGDIHLPVSIIIAGDRDITSQSPGVYALVSDIPIAVGGAVDGNIACAIPIIIRRNGQVFQFWTRQVGIISRINRIHPMNRPGPISRMVDRCVVIPIPVIVTRHGDISTLSQDNVL